MQLQRRLLLRSKLLYSRDAWPQSEYTYSMTLFSPCTQKCCLPTSVLSANSPNSKHHKQHARCMNSVKDVCHMHCDDHARQLWRAEHVPWQDPHSKRTKIQKLSKATTRLSTTCLPARESRWRTPLHRSRRRKRPPPTSTSNRELIV